MFLCISKPCDLVYFNVVFWLN
ncbi:hypothetical protein F383_35427 [Gossypium arboreum]|uniref:Uncharacterized protein n=1 Tax=Gossypium arboreum TaxID=29729 RepID=A0A0B0N2M8_GOSAR|nr:hypothetical protein F383_35427 [Gossypium arboreum]